MLLWYIETDLFCIEGVVVKRFFTLVCLVLCAFTLAVISFAHPGGTDGSGGHYNHDTGEYHYHHGYPEHQHEDGVCPYLYNDNTDHNSHSSKSFSFKAIDGIKDIWVFVQILAITFAVSMLPCYLIIFCAIGALLSKIFKKKMTESNLLFYFYLFFHITISVIITILIWNA